MHLIILHFLTNSICTIWQCHQILHEKLPFGGTVSWKNERFHLKHCTGNESYHFSDQAILKSTTKCKQVSKVIELWTIQCMRSGKTEQTFLLSEAQSYHYNNETHLHYHSHAGLMERNKVKVNASQQKYSSALLKFT